MGKIRRKSTPQRRAKQQRRADEFMTPAEGRLFLAEWAASINKAVADAEKAERLLVERRLQERHGGAPPLSDEVIGDIRNALRDVRQKSPKKDYKIYEWVARACHVSTGSVRKYDPDPRTPRRRKE